MELSIHVLTSKVGRGWNSRSQPSVCEVNAQSDTPPPRFSLEILLVQHTYFIVFFNHVQKINGIQKYVHVAKFFYTIRLSSGTTEVAVKCEQSTIKINL